MTRVFAEGTAWVAGLAGLVGAAIGWSISPETFPHSWLSALSAWLEWPIGCMGLLLTHALTGGRWGYAIRPQLLAGMATLLLLPLALIPLAIVAPSLYSWMRLEAAGHLANSFYLNLPAAIGRLVVYLVVWFGLLQAILQRIGANDIDNSLGRIAPAGLILLALTVTFSSIDATMSLDPRFASSVYGLVEIAETGLLALSVSIVAAAGLGNAAVRELSRILLATVILWGYLDFVQLLIVWQSDLPNEASWYAPRLSGAWGTTALAILSSHFALPFFALLTSRMQSSRFVVVAVALLLIAGEILRSWWLVLPPSRTNLDWIDFAVMVGVGGIAAAVALRAFGVMNA